ncbi:MAG: adenosylmethionine decarboxylase [Planctomycetota bacterium]
MEATGTHCILELYDCPSHLLDDEAFVTRTLREAVNQGMATLLGEVSHKFHPQGVTALALIAESHVAIHTWPECGYVAVDVFTCGDRASAEKACGYMVEAFQAGRHTMRKLARGLEVDGDAQAEPSAAAASRPAAPCQV